MRRLTLLPLVAVLALAAVATAAFGDSGTSGTTVQQFEGKFTATRPGRSVGLRIAAAATHPANAGDRQPKRITNFHVTFSTGTPIDTQTGPRGAPPQSGFAGGGGPPAPPPPAPE